MSAPGIGFAAQEHRAEKVAPGAFERRRDPFKRRALPAIFRLT
jgi:hypothetical protein